MAPSCTYTSLALNCAKLLTHKRSKKSVSFHNRILKFLMSLLQNRITMARTQPAPHWLEAEDLKIKTHRSPCLLCFIMFHINPKGTRYQWRSQCITGSVSQLLHEDWSTEQPNPTDFHDCSSNSIITRRARTHTGRMTASQTVVFTLPRCAVTCGINGTLQPALAVSELCSQWLWKGTEHKVDRKRGVLTALHGLLGCSEEVLQSGLYRSAFLLLPCLPPGSSAPVCGCVCLFWVALLDQKKKKPTWL